MMCGEGGGGRYAMVVFCRSIEWSEDILEVKYNLI